MSTTTEGDLRPERTWSTRSVPPARAMAPPSARDTASRASCRVRAETK